MDWADRRWRSVAIGAIVLGSLLMLYESMSLAFGVPNGVPRQVGPALLGLGIALFLIQRRAEKNDDPGPPN